MGVDLFLFEQTRGPNSHYFTRFLGTGIIHHTSSFTQKTLPTVGAQCLLVLYTVGSVTLACRSHSSTSLPGLILTQTHSRAQSCLAHWQCCQTTSKLSQHMDWLPNCSMTNKEPRMSNEIAWYELTAAGAAGSTFVFNYFHIFLAVLNLFKSFKEIFSHLNTFPSMSRILQTYPVICSYF